MDASFCVQSGKAGTGIIIRDHGGKVLLTAWKFMRHCGSPEEAVADACF
jgi:hypothetical protein